MNYQETTTWLFNQLPMFQMQGASAYKKDLTNTLLLVEHLQHPEIKFKSIHVAGTNGKGSTSSMLASILQEAGYKVGLYTSPHLKDFRERIRINGEMISEAFVVDFVAQNKSFFEANQLSFFEMTVGLAFDYFAKEQVDVAVIEVGMGGRLDSTNVISPLVSVITNIGFDHTQFLGDTLPKIAAEKAGIIKSNIPVVIGEYSEETKPVFVAKAKFESASIYFAQDNSEVTYECVLLGDYQMHNKKTVLQTIKLLQSQFNIEENHIKLGLKNVIQNTGLLGRWQILKQKPFTVCDTAHNSHGLKIVLNQIQKHQFKTLHVVLGVVNDKDLDSILPLFPKNANYYFCKPNVPRGLEPQILQKKATEFGLYGEVFNSVSEAYEEAINLAKDSDFIYIGGSTFVVAEIV
ncbi:bifunctional folylpolyglutamate synthase/dihydrofolate synthase [Flavobacterium lacisediminis]|uniref:Dihydrofolate synthase/folylpolyglutamate synthase n=1 Tax=Flavobacterium lacisediminis TaxID=2989705 RepID=A0ABT3EKV8_9FLAO|nr:folylpolyglutamate synthase/dihydrofolate synthase family protein [Flavobacterium lacisediminis]MCW1149205.1 bifunctional folylpolyglutamate synthase/dihydrofolate synthase [Flavobacterium lacisediminis]